MSAARGIRWPRNAIDSSADQPPLAGPGAALIAGKPGTGMPDEDWLCIKIADVHSLNFAAPGDRWRRFDKARARLQIEPGALLVNPPMQRLISNTAITWSFFRGFGRSEDTQDVAHAIVTRHLDARRLVRGILARDPGIFATDATPGWGKSDWWAGEQRSSPESSRGSLR
ncbi:hypothetical protein B0H17DRAFT_1147726 [Mycena rosella]|uniref:Uncharacterized protein n=1 Tax=Mycena rosella TaxID=1033263 RepID=A0AAD7G1Q0_MYCRO|nr:hypothetical protein B0H17DRAFT_1147726 [Mycena rosella]